jgi:hypothetical protein
VRSIDKSLLKLAIAIHAQLLRCDCREPLVELPTSQWQRCAELVSRARRARLRGWHLAANVLLKELSYSIPCIEQDLSALNQRLQRGRPQPRIVTAKDIYLDLIALRHEFEQVDCEVRDCCISVTTEPITLSGIYLGPFEIRVSWTTAVRGDSLRYQVIAKDPHPAESRSNVTHPHVMDETLCEGDGRHMIRQAMSQGRVLDFFMLVAGVLRNYNPESPYVELALWHGGSCSDCGASTGDEESYSCHKCGGTICSDCECLCSGCEESCCSDCLCSCASCNDNYCRRCLNSCMECQSRVCSDCLTENERCPNCHEAQLEDETSDQAAEAVNPEVHADGLGQTPVPA